LLRGAYYTRGFSRGRRKFCAVQINLRIRQNFSVSVFCDFGRIFRRKSLV
jgi:hypothetical protein